MGNISRDTFNSLKQYVGVRLQQGVPLVDADWNELEDIRRFELRAYLKWFVGDGVPAGNNGFAIQAIPGVDNDFLIVGGDGTAHGAGRCLVEGMDVFNISNIEYSQQTLVDASKATAMGVDPVELLTTPTADTDYIVYLDVWEREIYPGEPTDDQDIFDRNLINGDIGVPTCTRLKREWVVRVVDVSLPAPIPASGHDYYPLARLTRFAGQAQIFANDIIDMRRTGLAVPSQHDTRQIVRDAFGDSYTLDGDGQVDLKLNLRETINNLLRGEMPTTPVQAVTLDSSTNALTKAIQDQDGNSWWFWLSDRGGSGLDVWYNRYDIATASWDGETQLSVGAEVNNDLSLLQDLTGNIWVFWDSNSSGTPDIWYDHYNFTSGIWEGNNQLSTSVNTDRYQCPVIDQAGNIWLFWESDEGGDYNIWYNRYVSATATWDGVSQLTTDTGSDRQPTAIVDQDGNIWVFWYSSRSANNDIWFKRYTSMSSSWGSDTQLTTDAGSDSDPKAIMDLRSTLR